MTLIASGCEENMHTAVIDSVCFVWGGRVDVAGVRAQFPRGLPALRGGGGAGAGPPQHGLSIQNMGLITSEYGLNVLAAHQMAANHLGLCALQELVALAAHIAAQPHLTFGGLQAYYGKAQHIVDYAEREAAIASASRTVAAAVADLKAAGLPCPKVDICLIPFIHSPQPTTLPVSNCASAAGYVCPGSSLRSPGRGRARRRWRLGPGCGTSCRLGRTPSWTSLTMRFSCPTAPVRPLPDGC